MKRPVFPSARRWLCGVVAAVYGWVHVAGGQAAESRFWADRRAHLRRPSAAVASLPPAFAVPSAWRPSSTETVSRGLPAGADAAEADVWSALAGPHGTVRAVLRPAGGRAPRAVIVHVQDVHRNAEAQSRISAAVRGLIDRFAGATSSARTLSFIALEGDFGPIDLAPFRAFPHPAALARAADFMLGEGRISGPVRAGLSGSAPPFLGVDDEARHAANVAAYRAASPRAAAARAEIAARERALEGRKEAAFNPALKVFDAAVTAHHRGAASLGEYARAVAAAAPADSVLTRFVSALDAEAALDFRRVEAERTALVERLLSVLRPGEAEPLMRMSLEHRLGRVPYADFYRFLRDFCERRGVPLSAFPAMDGYVRYVLLTDALPAEALFKSLRAAERAAYAALARTPEERAIVRDGERLRLSDKLARFSLTPEEWDAFVSLGAHPDLPAMGAFEAFYREAVARDAAMSESFLRALRERPAAGGPPPLAVLVTGGFHAPGLARRLTEAGCAVVQFVPRIENVGAEEGTAYLSVFTQEKAPLQRFLEGRKLFLAEAPLDRAARRELALRAAASALAAGAGTPASALAAVDPALAGARLRRTPEGVVLSAPEADFPMTDARGGFSRAPPRERPFGAGLTAVFGAGMFIGFSESFGIALRSTEFQVFAGVFAFASIALSFVLHELAHSWTAEKLGDVTPRMGGQMSFLPWRFIGPGRAALSLLTTAIGFPIGFYSISVQPRLADDAHGKEHALLALAGPLGNLAQASLSWLVVAAAGRLLPEMPSSSWFGATLILFHIHAIQNALMFLLNMLPIGIFDGYRVVKGISSKAWTMRIELGFTAAVVFLLSAIIGYELGSPPDGNAPDAAWDFFSYDYFHGVLIAGQALLFAIVAVPWVRARWRAALAGRDRRRQLRAGRYPLRVWVHGFLKAQPLRAWIPLNLAVSKDFPLKEGILVSRQEFVRADARAKFNRAHRTRIDKESWARLGAGTLVAAVPHGEKKTSGGADAAERKKGVFILPASALGGAGRADLLAETADVARLVGDEGEGRALLRPAEVETVKALSRALDAPVYELNAPIQADHRRAGSYVLQGERRIFFVPLSVIAALSVLMGEERERRTGQLVEVLSRLREGVEGGRTARDVYAEIVSDREDVRAWMDGIHRSFEGRSFPPADSLPRAPGIEDLVLRAARVFWLRGGLAGRAPPKPLARADPALKDAALRKEAGDVVLAAGGAEYSLAAPDEGFSREAPRGGRSGLLERLRPLSIPLRWPELRGTLSSLFSAEAGARFLLRHGASSPAVLARRAAGLSWIVQSTWWGIFVGAGLTMLASPWFAILPVAAHLLPHYVHNALFPDAPLSLRGRKGPLTKQEVDRLVEQVLSSRSGPIRRQGIHKLLDERSRLSAEGLVRIAIHSDAKTGRALLDAAAPHLTRERRRAMYDELIAADLGAAMVPGIMKLLAGDPSQEAFERLEMMGERADRLAVTFRGLVTGWLAARKPRADPEELLAAAARDDSQKFILGAEIVRHLSTRADALEALVSFAAEPKRGPERLRAAVLKALDGPFFAGRFKPEHLERLKASAPGLHKVLRLTASRKKLPSGRAHPLPMASELSVQELTEARHFLRALGVFGGASVLEAGGDHSAYLEIGAPSFGAHYLGIHRREESFQEALHRVSAFNVRERGGSARLLQGRVSSLPGAASAEIEDGSQDFVIDLNAAGPGLMLDPDRLMDEALRVIKDGGILALGSAYDGWVLHGRDAMGRMVNATLSSDRWRGKVVFTPFFIGGWEEFSFGDRIVKAFKVSFVNPQATPKEEVLAMFSGYGGTPGLTGAMDALALLARQPRSWADVKDVLDLVKTRTGLTPESVVSTPDRRRFLAELSRLVRLGPAKAAERVEAARRLGMTVSADPVSASMAERISWLERSAPAGKTPSAPPEAPEDPEGVRLAEARAVFKGKLSRAEAKAAFESLGRSPSRRVFELLCEAESAADLASGPFFTAARRCLAVLGAGDLPLLIDVAMDPRTGPRLRELVMGRLAELPDSVDGLVALMAEERAGLSVAGAAARILLKPEFQRRLSRSHLDALRRAGDIRKTAYLRRLLESLIKAASSRDPRGSIFPWWRFYTENLAWAVEPGLALLPAGHVDGGFLEVASTVTGAALGLHVLAWRLYTGRWRAGLARAQVETSVTLGLAAGAAVLLWPTSPVLACAILIGQAFRHAWLNGLFRQERIARGAAAARAALSGIGRVLDRVEEAVHFRTARALGMEGLIIEEARVFSPFVARRPAHPLSVLARASGFLFWLSLVGTAMFLLLGAGDGLPGILRRSAGVVVGLPAFLMTWRHVGTLFTKDRRRHDVAGVLFGLSGGRWEAMRPADGWMRSPRVTEAEVRARFWAEVHSHPSSKGAWDDLNMARKGAKDWRNVAEAMDVLEREMSLIPALIPEASRRLYLQALKSIILVKMDNGPALFARTAEVLRERLALEPAGMTVDQRIVWMALCSRLIGREEWLEEALWSWAVGEKLGDLRREALDRKVEAMRAAYNAALRGAKRAKPARQEVRSPAEELAEKAAALPSAGVLAAVVEALHNGPVSRDLTEEIFRALRRHPSKEALPLLWELKPQAGVARGAYQAAVRDSLEAAGAVEDAASFFLELLMRKDPDAFWQGQLVGRLARLPEATEGLVASLPAGHIDQDVRTAIARALLTSAFQSRLSAAHLEPVLNARRFASRQDFRRALDALTVTILAGEAARRLPSGGVVVIDGTPAAGQEALAHALAEALGTSAAQVGSPDLASRHMPRDGYLVVPVDGPHAFDALGASSAPRLSVRLRLDDARARELYEAWLKGPYRRKLVDFERRMAEYDAAVLPSLQSRARSTEAMVDVGLDLGRREWVFHGSGAVARQSQAGDEVRKAADAVPTEDAVEAPVGGDPRPASGAMRNLFLSKDGRPFLELAGWKDFRVGFSREFAAELLAAYPAETAGLSWLFADIRTRFNTGSGLFKDLIPHTGRLYWRNTGKTGYQIFFTWSVRPREIVFLGLKSWADTAVPGSDHNTVRPELVQELQRRARAGADAELLESEDFIAFQKACFQDPYLSLAAALDKRPDLLERLEERFFARARAAATIKDAAEVFSAEFHPLVNSLIGLFEVAHSEEKKKKFIEESFLEYESSRDFLLKAVDMEKAWKGLCERIRRLLRTKAEGLDFAAMRSLYYAVDSVWLRNVVHNAFMTAVLKADRWGLRDRLTRLAEGYRVLSDPGPLSGRVRPFGDPSAERIFRAHGLANEAGLPAADPLPSGPAGTWLWMMDFWRGMFNLPLRAAEKVPALRRLGLRPIPADSEGFSFFWRLAVAPGENLLAGAVGGALGLSPDEAWFFLFFAPHLLDVALDLLRGRSVRRSLPNAVAALALACAGMLSGLPVDGRGAISLHLWMNLLLSLGSISRWAPSGEALSAAVPGGGDVRMTTGGGAREASAREAFVRPPLWYGYSVGFTSRFLEALEAVPEGRRTRLRWWIEEVRASLKTPGVLNRLSHEGGVYNLRAGREGYRVRFLLSEEDARITFLSLTPKREAGREGLLSQSLAAESEALSSPRFPALRDRFLGSPYVDLVAAFHADPSLGRYMKRNLIVPLIDARTLREAVAVLQGVSSRLGVGYVRSDLAGTVDLLAGLFETERVFARVRDFTLQALVDRGMPEEAASRRAGPFFRFVHHEMAAWRGAFNRVKDLVTAELARGEEADLDALWSAYYALDSDGLRDATASKVWQLLMRSRDTADDAARRAAVAAAARVHGALADTRHLGGTVSPFNDRESESIFAAFRIDGFAADREAPSSGDGVPPAAGTWLLAKDAVLGAINAVRRRMGREPVPDGSEGGDLFWRLVVAPGGENLLAALAGDMLGLPPEWSWFLLFFAPHLLDFLSLRNQTRALPNAAAAFALSILSASLGLPLAGEWAIGLHFALNASLAAAAWWSSLPVRNGRRVVPWGRVLLAPLSPLLFGASGRGGAGVRPTEKDVRRRLRGWDLDGEALGEAWRGLRRAGRLADRWRTVMAAIDLFRERTGLLPEHIAEEGFSRRHYLDALRRIAVHGMKGLGRFSFAEGFLRTRLAMDASAMGRAEKAVWLRTVSQVMHDLGQAEQGLADWEAAKSVDLRAEPISRKLQVLGGTLNPAWRQARERELAILPVEGARVEDVEALSLAVLAPAGRSGKETDLARRAALARLIGAGPAGWSAVEDLVAGGTLSLNERIELLSSAAGAMPPDRVAAMVGALFGRGPVIKPLAKEAFECLASKPSRESLPLLLALFPHRRLSSVSFNRAVRASLSLFTTEDVDFLLRMADADVTSEFVWGDLVLERVAALPEALDAFTAAVNNPELREKTRSRISRILAAREGGQKRPGGTMLWAWRSLARVGWDMPFEIYRSRRAWLVEGALATVAGAVAWAAFGPTAENLWVLLAGAYGTFLAGHLVDPLLESSRPETAERRYFHVKTVLSAAAIVLISVLPLFSGVNPVGTVLRSLAIFLALHALLGLSWADLGMPALTTGADRLGREAAAVQAAAAAVDRLERSGPAAMTRRERRDAVAALRAARDLGVGSSWSELWLRLLLLPPGDDEEEVLLDKLARLREGLDAMTWKGYTLPEDGGAPVESKRYLLYPEPVNGTKLSVVRKVHDRLTGTDRLLKTGLKGYESMVTRESVVIRRLDGVPGILRTWGLIKDEEGRPSLVMEWAKGGDMRQHILGKPLGLQGFAAFSRRVLRALDAIHQAGLVFRDLKLENLYLLEPGDPGSVVIGDFGLATTAVSAGKNDSSAGTPAHMSAEMVEKRRSSPSSDIYALGCAFHEALTGRPLFQDVSARSSPEEHAARKSDLRPRRLELEKAGVPPAVADVVLGMMEYRPEDRLYKTADEALAALEAAFARPAPARAPPAFETVQPFRFPKYIWDVFRELLAGHPDLLRAVRRYGLAWTDEKGRLRWIDEKLRDGRMEEEWRRAVETVWRLAMEAVNEAHGWDDGPKRLTDPDQVRDRVAFHESVHRRLRSPGLAGLFEAYKRKVTEELKLHRHHAFISMFMAAYGKPKDLDRMSNEDVVEWVLEEFLAASLFENVLFSDAPAVMRRMMQASHRKRAPPWAVALIHTSGEFLVAEEKALREATRTPPASCRHLNALPTRNFFLAGNLARTKGEEILEGLWGDLEGLAFFERWLLLRLYDVMIEEGRSDLKDALLHLLHLVQKGEPPRSFSLRWVWRHNLLIDSLRSHIDPAETGPLATIEDLMALTPSAGIDLMRRALNLLKAFGLFAESHEARTRTVEQKRELSAAESALVTLIEKSTGGRVTWRGNALGLPAGRGMRTQLSPAAFMPAESDELLVSAVLSPGLRVTRTRKIRARVRLSPSALAEVEAAWARLIAAADRGDDPTALAAPRADLARARLAAFRLWADREAQELMSWSQKAASSSRDVSAFAVETSFLLKENGYDASKLLRVLDALQNHWRQRPELRERVNDLSGRLVTLMEVLSHGEVLWRGSMAGEDSRTFSPDALVTAPGMPAAFVIGRVAASGFLPERPDLEPLRPARVEPLKVEAPASAGERAQAPVLTIPVQAWTTLFSPGAPRRVIHLALDRKSGGLVEVRDREHARRQGLVYLSFISIASGSYEAVMGWMGRRFLKKWGVSPRRYARRHAFWAENAWAMLVGAAVAGAAAGLSEAPFLPSFHGLTWTAFALGHAWDVVRSWKDPTARGEALTRLAAAAGFSLVFGGFPFFMAHAYPAQAAGIFLAAEALSFPAHALWNRLAAYRRAARAGADDDSGVRPLPAARSEHGLIPVAFGSIAALAGLAAFPSLDGALSRLLASAAFLVPLLVARSVFARLKRTLRSGSDDIALMAADAAVAFLALAASGLLAAVFIFPGAEGILSFWLRAGALDRLRDMSDTMMWVNAAGLAASLASAVMHVSDLAPGVRRITRRKAAERYLVLALLHGTASLSFLGLGTDGLELFLQSGATFRLLAEWEDLARIGFALSAADALTGFLLLRFPEKPKGRGPDDRWPPSSDDDGPGGGPKGGLRKPEMFSAAARAAEGLSLRAADDAARILRAARRGGAFTAEDARALLLPPPEALGAGATLSAAGYRREFAAALAAGAAENGLSFDDVLDALLAAGGAPSAALPAPARPPEPTSVRVLEVFGADLEAARRQIDAVTALNAARGEVALVLRLVTADEALGEQLKGLVKEAGAGDAVWVRRVDLSGPLLAADFDRWRGEAGLAEKPLLLTFSMPAGLSAALRAAPGMDPRSPYLRALLEALKAVPPAPADVHHLLEVAAAVARFA